MWKLAAVLAVVAGMASAERIGPFQSLQIVSDGKILTFSDTTLQTRPPLNGDPLREPRLHGAFVFYEENLYYCEFEGRAQASIDPKVTCFGEKKL